MGVGLAVGVGVGEASSVGCGAAGFHVVLDEGEVVTVRQDQVVRS